MCKEFPQVFQVGDFRGGGKKDNEIKAQLSGCCGALKNEEELHTLPKESRNYASNACSTLKESIDPEFSLSGTLESSIWYFRTIANVHSFDVAYKGSSFIVCG